MENMKKKSHLPYHQLKRFVLDRVYLPAKLRAQMF